MTSGRVGVMTDRSLWNHSTALELSVMRTSTGRSHPELAATLSHFHEPRRSVCLERLDRCTSPEMVSGCRYSYTMPAVESRSKCDGVDSIRRSRHAGLSAP